MPRSQNKRSRKTSAVVALRRVMPDRPLRLAEAYVLAERQATRLLEVAHLQHAPVPDSVVSRLPRVRVERRMDLTRSGMTEWFEGAWRITINAAEPPFRQRFTLAHELKHVLDHPFLPRAYGSIPGTEPGELAERICDYFAACLLMPRMWVKRAYCDQGIQSVSMLARIFAVSPTAMRVRLLQLGLIEPVSRCAPYYRNSSEADPELLTRSA